MSLLKRIKNKIMSYTDYRNGIEESEGEIPDDSEAEERYLNYLKKQSKKHYFRFKKELIFKNEK